MRVISCFKEKFIGTLIALLCLLPFVPLIITAIGFDYRWPSIFPSEFTLRGIEYVFLDNIGTYQGIVTTVFIALSVIIIDLILALPAAMALERYKFKGKTLCKMILFAPIIVPPFTAIMGLYTVFIKLSLTENILGVIIAHILPTLPYMIRALMVPFSTINSDLEDQARVLGANGLKRLYYIVLPHLLPGIFAGSILVFLISASQYFLTLLVGGGSVTTLPIIMIPFINGGDKAIGSVYTISFSLVALISICLLDFILRRYYKNKNIKVI
ncbi:ABC transporter permease [Clostridium sp.]|uniref:ABC transporter permease n=1 Tax=Clostridium sp. TaxID=1506 RepID=UPI002FC65EC7